MQFRTRVFLQKLSFKRQGRPAPKPRRPEHLRDSNWSLTIAGDRKTVFISFPREFSQTTRAVDTIPAWDSFPSLLA